MNRHKCKLFSIAVVLLTGTLYFAGCSSGKTTAEGKPPEQMLAFHDGHLNPSESDSDVMLIRTLLQSISAKMNEPIPQVADETHRATEVLKSHGVTLTNLAFLVKADKAMEMPEKVKKGMTYRDLTLLLISEIETGKTKENQGYLEKRRAWKMSNGFSPV
jgi:hypothetical protein